MATITTLRVARSNQPHPDINRPARSFRMKFSPTELATDVSSGDYVALGELPKDANVITASLRLTGVASENGGWLQLALNENSTISNLTQPMSSTYSGQGAFIASPATVTTYVKTLQLYVGGGNLDTAATGIVEVNCFYDVYKDAG